jgi:hypothetical protein
MIGGIAAARGIKSVNGAGLPLVIDGNITMSVLCSKQQSIKHCFY